jgi:hypothetical protein
VLLLSTQDVDDAVQMQDVQASMATANRTVTSSTSSQSSPSTSSSSWADGTKHDGSDDDDDDVDADNKDDESTHSSSSVDAIGRRRSTTAASRSTCGVVVCGRRDLVRLSCVADERAHHQERRCRTRSRWRAHSSDCKSRLV